MNLENIQQYLLQLANTQQIILALLLSSSAVHVLLFMLILNLYKRLRKLASKPAVVLPDIYKGELNTARIKAYQELLKEFKVEEGTIRHIFSQGAHFYKEAVREANDKTTNDGRN